MINEASAGAWFLKKKIMRGPLISINRDWRPISSKQQEAPPPLCNSPQWFLTITLTVTCMQEEKKKSVYVNDLAQWLLIILVLYPQMTMTGMSICFLHVLCMMALSVKASTKLLKWTQKWIASRLLYSPQNCLFGTVRKHNLVFFDLDVAVFFLPA